MNATNKNDPWCHSITQVDHNKVPNESENKIKYENSLKKNVNLHKHQNKRKISEIHT